MSTLRIFLQLLKTDILMYKSAIYDSIINNMIYFTTTVLVFSYVFPMMGMSTGFGVFMATTTIASCIFWTSWDTSVIFVADIEGNKTIEYPLTLPIPNYLVFIKQLLGYAIKALVPALFLLPLGKLLLFKRMDLTNFSVLKFACVITLISIFVGAFTLFIASRVKGIHHAGNIGIRFLFTMWIFGCSNYPWYTLYNFSTTFAYATLLNPLMYIMEGMRAAVLGQAGCINFWICVAMIITFTLCFGYLGIARLRKRLDFV